MTVSDRGFAPFEGSNRTTLLTRLGWFNFGAAFLILGSSAQLAAQIIDPTSWAVHGLWCVVGLAIVVPVLAKVLQAGITVVLRDHRVTFTGAFGLYFLFGAALLAFGPEQQIAAVLGSYSLDAADALRIDAINATGFGLAVMTSIVSTGQWLGRQADRVAVVARRVPAPSVMIALMIVGVLSSFHVLMVDFGLREGPVPGIWRAAGRFLLVAIVLGTAYQGRHALGFQLLAVALAVVESMSGVLLFNKTVMLLPIAALAVGFSVRYGVRKVLPASALLLALLFSSVGGAVLYGRNTLEQDTPHWLGTRWQVFKEGFTAIQTGADVAPYNTWGRLCYVPAQVAAFDFYNAGMGGEDLRLIPWLFVPRAFVPQKPVITQSGTDFYLKLTGHAGSSTGMGVFASGYYNAGWLGVFLAAMICGWLLAQTSAIANSILRRKALLLLPIALVGVLMAFRIDGHFVSDYIGAFIIALYPLLFCSLVFGLRPRSGTADISVK